MITVRSIFKAGIVAGALAMTAFSPAANASQVLHEGNILDFVQDGVRFSFLHKSSNGMGNGGAVRQLTGDEVAYTWDTGANDTFETGTTATFNIRELTIFDKVISGRRYELNLLNSANSVLTVGDQLSSTGGSGPHFVTHSIGGSLDFRLDEFNADNTLRASITDTFNFANAIMMGLVNGVQQLQDESVEIFLWGDTGRGTATGSQRSNSFTCVEGNCSTIAYKFYDKHGLGIDLAFTGVEPIPVPAALPLLGTALAGIFLVGRRRRKFAA